MVKIGNNKYLCPWCLEEISHEKVTAGKPKNFSPNPNERCCGHGRVSATLKCPKCNRKVSQRRSDGSK